jgi:hypothetical protein
LLDPSKASSYPERRSDSVYATGKNLYKQSKPNQEKDKNTFLEFDEQLPNCEASLFFISWLEIDLCIHSYFPTLSLDQIQAIRFKIMEIFQKNNFSSARLSKSNLITSEKLKIYLETKGFTSFAKDRHFKLLLRGKKGVRLKHNIFDIILDKYV